MKTLFRVLGPLGYLGKGFLYGTIGVLTMMSALSSSEEDINDESPQGVFLLLNDSGSGTGLVLMVLLLVFILCYIMWRLLEAFFVRTTPNLEQVSTGFRRFFRYRFSPLISAIIYSVYAFFLIDTIIERRNSVDSSSCFPQCWQDNGWGIAGLALLGVAFAIGFFSQVEMACRRDFITEIKPRVRMHLFLKLWLYITGCLGIIGRALLFGLVSISFFLLASGTNIWVDKDHGTLGQALNHWIYEPGGRFFLFLTGFLLLIFAVFVLSSMFCRSFPTNVVSRDNVEEEVEMQEVEQV